MAEYISRDEAIERIQPHVKPQTVYGEGYLQAIEHATAILELMPAADVQPIRRGRWERTAYPSFRICSECRAWWSSDITDNCFTNYCPKCGARMDLKDGDTE